MWLLRTRFGQEAIQFVLRKGDADLTQVLTDQPGILSLAAYNVSCRLLQLVLFRIKPIAEYISQLTAPRGTHFHRGQEWELFLRRKQLSHRSGIHPIMIGDR